MGKIQSAHTLAATSGLRSAEILESVAALSVEFAATAVERDERGGTAKHERDRLRASGLLRQSVPVASGGLGDNWVGTLQTVRTIARVDSSLAHLFAFHHLMLATVQFFGSETQAASLLKRTVDEGWFWGNALNPLDTRTRIERTADGWEISGTKSFCSGASDSDMLIVSALEDPEGRLRIAAIPTHREGIRVHGDWDNMGQRQTDSGTVSFDRVAVRADELLLDPGPMGSPHASLRPSLAQLILTNIYLGIAEGALQEAKSYLHGLPVPSLEKIRADPYVLRTIGDLWVEVAGATTLADRALASFQTGWDAGRSGVTPAQRGTIAIDIATAKVAATRASLSVSSRMFEVLGARATAARLRLDRYWRNARTHTLHDPVDYKLRELGDWLLNERVPTPSFYS